MYIFSILYEKHRIMVCRFSVLHSSSQGNRSIAVGKAVKRTVSEAERASAELVRKE